MIFNHLSGKFIVPHVLADEKSSEKQTQNFLRWITSSPKSVLHSSFSHRQTTYACPWEIKQLRVANPSQLTQVTIGAKPSKELQPPRQPTADLGLLTMLQPFPPLNPLNNSGHQSQAHLSLSLPSSASHTCQSMETKEAGTGLRLS